MISFGCSDDSGTNSNDVSGVKIVVSDVSNSSKIENANVVLYNANNNESIMRKFTDASGECTFEVSPGTYHVRITAQGYKELPAESSLPVPFTIPTNQIITQPYELSTTEISLPGQISGHIVPATNNVLVLASHESMTRYSTVSGPDGFFVLFNLPYGAYQVTPYQAGIEGNSVTTSLSADTPNVSIDLNVAQSDGSVLFGSVTFLASPNAIVDISLLDPITLSAIPGLSTSLDSSKNYTIELIPSGDFIAWASFQNDGYVMDPDWIRKNPGTLDVSFITGDTTELNFSVTGAIGINHPTNPPDSVFPVIADSAVVEFSWEKYPSTKEYIIKVIKSNGDVIWGGYNPDGSINHAQISGNLNSIEYDFDGSASEQLQAGKTYQWLLYSDNDDASGIQGLISSSEIQMGLFRVPE